MATLTLCPLNLKVLAILLCFAVAFNLCDVPLRPQEMVSLLEEGKRQYNLVSSKTTMPSFGTCWRTAVSQLHGGCNHLNDRIQSDIALGFANCFLEGAGLPRHDCEEADSGQKEVCLKSMSDRAFIAYTEFFTHTQSMCFFIMSQVWHDETEKTIHRLSTSAADVARQLEVSEELQEELLMQQRQSVAVQQELLENGVNLGSMLHESRDSLKLIFSEFRSSTLEQQRLLSMVFHHLSTLQSWIVGEVSWIDSIAFYIPSFVFVYFLTSAQRTTNARIPAFLILLLAGLIERFASYVLLNDAGEPGTFQPVDIINERLSWWIWLVRRSAIASNVGILLVVLYCYKDREQVMHQLLEQIRRQNEELLKKLTGGMKDEVNGLNKPRSLDETDGFGYMAVLANSSPLISGRTSNPSVNASISGRTSNSRENASGITIMSVSNSSDYTVPIVNGVTPPTRRITLGSPGIPSAFRPIQMDSVELNGSVEIPIPDVISSTPKTRSKRRTNEVSSSPGGTRYNLRKSRAVASPL